MIRTSRLAALSLVLLSGLATPVAALAASLSLSPSSGTFYRGCAYTVTVNIDTAGVKTDGVDAILTYEPTKFTVNASQIGKGKLFPDYPGNTVDSTAGKITLAALASPTAPVSGKGAMVTIPLQVTTGAALGATQLKFDYDPLNPGKTTDSNVVETGGTLKDLLTSVTDGNYTIAEGTCPAVGATQTTKTLPDSGMSLPTFVLAGLGTFLLLAGLIGLLAL